MARLSNKDIPDYEDHYYLDPETMTVVNKKTGRHLKPHIDNKGYPEVQLWKDNKGKHKYLHRLFAEAYIPNPDNLPCINHKDEDTTNYDLDNLDWCDQSYNQNYGTANERRSKSISEASAGKPRTWVSRYKSKPIIVTDIYGEEKYYPSAVAAGQDLGIRPNQITAVVRGDRQSFHGMKARKA